MTRLRPEVITFLGLTLLGLGMLFDMLAERESNRGRVVWVACATTMLGAYWLAALVCCVIDLFSRGLTTP